ncbi:MAG: AAA family ATPase [Betaproteobacteria bacterium]|nr:AAA family ATPase [Betaproteobacteria bacterium]
MKLARLLLQAFGPFTDAELDFSRSPANLHLIYGPNEAGKSSALRAMTDLRFGIPLRSQDVFIHASGDLRIAGVFVDRRGEELALVRRKGRGQTLSRLDLVSGQEDSGRPLLAEHEQALTGGLERSDFEAMFGLNHARLREGGRQLLEGEGELRSALFEASAGTRGIPALLDALDAEARKLYNPHGRTQKAQINQARDEITEQRQLCRQAQTRPADWQALFRAHDDAKASLTEVERKLEGLRRRENELTELRTVAPLLREVDHAEAELRELANVPDLPENAREERLAAEHALRQAQKDRDDAELELARYAEALTKLVIEPQLLEHGAAIERLAAGIEPAARARLDAGQQQAIIDRIEGDLSQAATRIAPAQPLRDMLYAVLNAVPSAADRAALDAHLLALGRLQERLDSHRQQADDLDQKLQADSGNDPALPDTIAHQTLVATLRRAQSLGEVSRHNDSLGHEIRDLDSRLSRALSDLGLDTDATLRAVQPLLEAEIAQTRQELVQLDESRRQAQNDERNLARDQEAQRLRQRELAAAGEVVTAETLRLARERRDQGWRLIRDSYIERTLEPGEAGHAFDPSRPLPDAFESAQGETDRQADLLRADARRAAGYEECSARIEQMAARREALAAEIGRCQARIVAVRAEWSGRLTQARLPNLEPDALREWLARRNDALELADRRTASQDARDRLLTQAASAAAELETALRGVDQALPARTDALANPPLPGLIEQALRWDKRVAKLEAEHEARVKATHAAREERDKIAKRIADTTTQRQQHETALQGWHARLFLSAGSPPEIIRARLEELDGLARQSTALGDARFRQAQHEALVADFATQAAQLAPLLATAPASASASAPALATALATPLAPLSADDIADRLRQRLHASREADQRRHTLLEAQSKATLKRRQAEIDLSAQSSVLAKLCQAASVAAAGDLPHCEELAARKRHVRIALATAQRQLKDVSTRPEPSLREALTGLDQVAIESDRERCRGEIDQLEQDLGALRRNEEQTRRELEAIDTSDKAATAREAMESAAARMRAAIRPWARLKLAQALLREALNRFRERAQAPMIAAASTYFSLMTGGRYPRLVTDDSQEKSVLLAERADGETRIGIEAMSEGTADQLYLALRLAALDLRQASQQMPLVLDDVLITSDDERAANILHALAKFAEGGQVMLFTHHRHLVDLARAELGDQSIGIHSL